MLEESVQERGELALHELGSPESVPAFAANTTFNPGRSRLPRAIPRCWKVRSPRGLHRLLKWKKDGRGQPSSPGMASCVAAPLSPRSEWCCSLLF
jgi:hypothetical protein